METDGEEGPWAGPLRIDRLNSTHILGGFRSGEPRLDAYLTQGRGFEDVRRRGAVIYVLVPARPADPAVLGYCTIGAFRLNRADAAASHRRKLPRYEDVPAVLIGRLAVTQEVQGQGLGRTLLYDAIRRVVEIGDRLGCSAIVVHALHDRASHFYEAHGFTRFPDNPHHLYLPLHIAEAHIL